MEKTEIELMELQDPQAHGEARYQELPDQLWPRLMEYVDDVSRNEDQVKCWEGIGRYWRNVRLQTGMSREEVARVMGNVTKQELALFENGLLRREALAPGFIIQLAKALGKPEAIQQFAEVMMH